MARFQFDFFGLNSMKNAPAEDKPPRKGVLRYLQVFWENLGKLLLGNLLCCVGFLPVALGVSLGVTYGNFWLALVGGAVGGAVAGPVWTAMFDLALRCFGWHVDGWFSGFRHTIKNTWKSAAPQGAVLGAILSTLLAVGSFASDLMEQGVVPALVVWVALGLDFFLLSLAAALLFPPLCFERQPFSQRVKTALGLLMDAPVRTLAATLGILIWGALLVGLFPVSVPLAAVLGFWPVALLTAQLQRPGLLDRCGEQEEPPDPAYYGKEPGQYTIGQRSEIWWRRHWGVVLAIVGCVSLALGVIRTLVNIQEPDLQIAVVHADSLPDAVVSALEDSLAEAVGDLNGDGAAVVLVNDYQVVFDGSATNADVQTAGSTLLVTDIAGNESSLFVVEDADSFLELYENKVDGEAAKTWSEYPILAGLDAGTYSTVVDIEENLSGQDLLADYTVFAADSADSDALALLLGE